MRMYLPNSKFALCIRVNQYCKVHTELVDVAMFV